MDEKRAREILEDYIDNITHVGPVTEAIRYMLEQEPKADMVAMLTDLQLDIEETEHFVTSHSADTYVSYNEIWKLIQQKIEKLKEVSK